ncbi:hypothetical protein WG908_11885 [Sphingobium sp. AN641]|uniref:hypothetical protein n=1 Tax=Sphingobium sp. AN641 TaxID=3133443 RepID=UPI0030C42339
MLIGTLLIRWSWRVAVTMISPSGRSSLAFAGDAAWPAVSPSLPAVCACKAVTESDAATPERSIVLKQDFILITPLAFVFVT